MDIHTLDTFLDFNAFKSMMIQQKNNLHKSSSAEASPLLDYFLSREELEFSDLEKLLELENFASKK
jgi:hypothetical protein